MHKHDCPERRRVLAIHESAVVAIAKANCLTDEQMACIISGLTTTAAFIDACEDDHPNLDDLFHKVMATAAEEDIRYAKLAHAAACAKCSGKRGH